MFRTSAFLTAVAALSLLSACSAGSASSSSDDVAVYTSEEEIEGEFEVIEFLQLPEGGTGGYGNGAQVLPQMKAMAARLGANGLLVISDTDEVASARVRAAASQGASYNRSRYVAIRVVSDRLPTR